MAFVKGLRTPTIYNAIAHAKLLGEVVRFGFPESTCDTTSGSSAFRGGSSRSVTRSAASIPSTARA